MYDKDKQTKKNRQQRTNGQQHWCQVFHGIKSRKLVHPSCSLCAENVLTPFDAIAILDVFSGLIDELFKTSVMSGLILSCLFSGETDSLFI